MLEDVRRRRCDGPGRCWTSSAPSLQLNWFKPDSSPRPSSVLDLGRDGDSDGTHSFPAAVSPPARRRFRVTGVFPACKPKITLKRRAKALNHTCVLTLSVLRRARWLNASGIKFSQSRCVCSPKGEGGARARIASSGIFLFVPLHVLPGTTGKGNLNPTGSTYPGALQHVC